MRQNILPYKYEKEKGEFGVTSLAGLPMYFDLMQAVRLKESIEKHLGIMSGKQGWTDAQIVGSLIMLNLAGGESVDDLEILEADEGLCQVIRKVEDHKQGRRNRREKERRFRKERKRTIPSQTSVFRYLNRYHDEKQQELRIQGKAFIPKANNHLRGLEKINSDLMMFAQRNNPESIATLDMDATLVETHKKEAFHCYKKYKAYQPLNVRWFEQELVTHTEFRDGNVSANNENLRVLKEALEVLPEGVEKVYFRSDGAAYEHKLLKYCDSGKNERFGKIEFAISSYVTEEFKKAVKEISEKEWRPLKKEKPGQEWAEVCFVPNAVGHSKYGLDYRYIAIREIIRQKELPGIKIQKELPFQTIEINKTDYKLFAIVTNRDIDGEELIKWHRERCGYSEQEHSVMKSDLAGGKMPSGAFGANAAWWWIMMLALNLNVIMKKQVLRGPWSSKRMKAIRYNIINLPGRVISHAGQLLIRISKKHPSFGTLILARKRIFEMIPGPSG